MYISSVTISPPSSCSFCSFMSSIWQYNSCSISTAFSSLPALLLVTNHVLLIVVFTSLSMTSTRFLVSFLSLDRTHLFLSDLSCFSNYHLGCQCFSTSRTSRTFSSTFLWLVIDLVVRLKSTVFLIFSLLNFACILASVSRFTACLFRPSSSPGVVFQSWVLAWFNCDDAATAVGGLTDTDN